MKVIITKKCLKQIGKLNIQIADKVFQKLEEIRKMPNPRAEGKALQGNYIDSIVNTHERRNSNLTKWSEHTISHRRIGKIGFR